MHAIDGMLLVALIRLKTILFLAQHATATSCGNQSSSNCFVIIQGHGIYHQYIFIVAYMYNYETGSIQQCVSYSTFQDFTLEFPTNRPRRSNANGGGFYASSRACTNHNDRNKVHRYPDNIGIYFQARL